MRSIPSVQSVAFSFNRQAGLSFVLANYSLEPARGTAAASFLALTSGDNGAKKIQRMARSSGRAHIPPKIIFI
jgi:hypothetical protein